MISKNKPITITLESDSGNAILTLGSEKKNVAMKWEADIAAASNDAEKYELVCQRVISRIISIEGYTHEDGSAVTPEDFKTGNVYESDRLAIVMGLITYFNSKSEAEEKNEPSKLDASSATVG